MEELVAFMDKTPRAGIAAGQLLNRDGSKQNSLDNFPSLLTLTMSQALLSLLWPKRFLGKRRRYPEPIEVESVVGACMLVRKEAMEEVGPLDEDYFFFFEETDWCFRMRKKGWGVYHIPGARVIHLQGATAERFHSRARLEFYRSRYLFCRKHRGGLALAELRVTVFMKLVFNLLFLTLSCLASAGTVAEWRRRLATYARLLFWHLRLCPEGNGLREIEERAFVVMRRNGVKLKMLGRYKEALLGAGIEGVEKLVKRGRGRIIKDGGRSTVFSLALAMASPERWS